jgi:hypothetical protein
MAESEPKQSKTSTATEEILKSQIEQEPIIIPPNLTVYANHLGLGMTVFDFAVLFGEALGVKDGRTVIQQRVKVLLSPMLAKIAARYLSEGVAQYEKQFGEIKESTGGTAYVEKG